MSLTRTWYTLDEVHEKFGLDRGMVTGWVEDGTVRAEQSGTKILRVNIDDVELKVQELTGI